jgi:hypothetical protein
MTPSPTPLYAPKCLSGLDFAPRFSPRDPAPAACARDAVHILSLYQTRSFGIVGRDCRPVGEKRAIPLAVSIVSFRSEPTVTGWPKSPSPLAPG